MAKALEALLDELYATPPSGFTKKRDALAKEAESKEQAAQLKARRKPTQAAYTLNQLARHHADDVADLVDTGRALARAQRKAIRGEAGADLREAIARQRDVVRRLTTKTASLMRELGLGAEGHLDEIAAALQAALVDPAVGEALEKGHLEKVPEPAASFAFVPAGEAIPKPTRRRQGAATKKAARDKARAERREATKKAARDEARAEHARAVEAAKRALDERETEATALEAKATETETRAKQLLAESKRIARAAGAARRAASAAKKKLANLAARPRELVSS